MPGKIASVQPVNAQVDGGSAIWTLNAADLTNAEADFTVSATSTALRWDVIAFLAYIVAYLLYRTIAFLARRARLRPRRSDASPKQRRGRPVRAFLSRTVKVGKMPLPGTEPIDLRSDTKTQPDEQMRLAMSRAEVGMTSPADPTAAARGDVGGDPRHEAGLFVVSGTMGNPSRSRRRPAPARDHLRARRSHLPQRGCAFRHLRAAAALIPGARRWTGGRRGRDLRRLQRPRRPHRADRSEHNNVAGARSCRWSTFARLVTRRTGMASWSIATAHLQRGHRPGVSAAELAVPVDTIQSCFEDRRADRLMICGTREFIEARGV